MRPARIAVIAAALLGIAHSAAAQTTFFTYSGLASAGAADGTGGAARFFNPLAVAINPATGDLFIADSGNHTIRKMTPAGVVTTLAGTALMPGHADGTGAAARFQGPRGIAFNSTTGILYVTETSHVIRAVTLAGVVTTLAGTAFSAGSADGSGGAARFDLPAGITVDGVSGTIYVADTNNHIIRAVTPAGAVTTLAGSADVPGTSDGTGSAARFISPEAVSVNPANGLVYVADTGANTLRLASTTTGQVTTWAGAPGVCGSTNGNAGAARFCAPRGIWVDVATWNVYVADSTTNLIRRVTAAGVVSTLAGVGPCAGIDGPGNNSAFCSPRGLVLNSGTGTLYVADSLNHAIRAVTLGGVVTTPAGLLGRGFWDGGIEGARFGGPGGVAVNRTTGVVYVADSGNQTIRAISPDGEVTTLAGTAGLLGATDGTGSAARFRNPRGLAVDQATGIIYVADSGNHTIRAITPAGVVTTLAGLGFTSGSADGAGSTARFNLPTALAVNPAAGLLYVADSNNHTIRLVTLGGTVTTWAGAAGAPGATDGFAGAARFSNPQGIAVDLATWTVYVADTSNHTIRVITPGGVVSTLAGAAGSFGFVEGVGADARFTVPRGATFFGGVLYVTDQLTVRAVTVGGAVTRVAGFIQPGSDDGVGMAARFLNPFAVDADAVGALYVADTGNNAIRVGETTASVSGDFDGDGIADFALFGPATGRWRAQLSSAPEESGFLPLGLPGDIPVPADYDGDGRKDPGVFRPSTGGWHLVVDIFNGGTPINVGWGGPGDVPVPADYDGDGKADIAVFRPSTVEWFIIRSSTSTLLHVAWGAPGDVPMPADYDGDGAADIAVFRPSTMEWFIIKSSTSTLLHVAWGAPGDRPVPEDYDGDGKADISVYRPSTGEWFIIRSTSSTLLYVAWGGTPGMIPLPADYDGDGRADITVYYPANGTWYIIQSSDSAGRIVTWP